MLDGPDESRARHGTCLQWASQEANFRLRVWISWVGTDTGQGSQGLDDTQSAPGPPWAEVPGPSQQSTGLPLPLPLEGGRKGHFQGHVQVSNQDALSFLRLHPS